ncbi:DUF4194 domain-containing protein [Uliginosibacterium sp. sgz301328]|uniref:DUF4194 domain-containing protein n=1 Tax=Uliginosibacterium sp. sgz301328 TaxID=3243764 RepID=UPI00359EEF43
MPRNWDQIAESTEGKYVPSDFKQAMYQMVVGQCLYARFQRQAVSYRLISTYRKEFKEALDLMGLELGFNDSLQYCYVRQDTSKLIPMDLQETFFLVTLRKLYHSRASVGDLTAEGDARVGIEEFETHFKELAKRDFDKRGGSLRELLKASKAKGLAREIEPEDGDPQPFAISINPGIVDILSEYALNRFSADLKVEVSKGEHLIDHPKTDSAGVKP